MLSMLVFESEIVETTSICQHNIIGPRPKCQDNE